MRPTGCNQCWYSPLPTPACVERVLVYILLTLKSGRDRVIWQMRRHCKTRENTHHVQSLYIFRNSNCGFKSNWSTYAVAPVGKLTFSYKQGRTPLRKAQLCLSLSLSSPLPWLNSLQLQPLRNPTKCLDDLTGLVCLEIVWQPIKWD